MATRDKKKIEAALGKKGFQKHPKDHNFWVYCIEEGARGNIFTKTSHTPKMKVIGDALFAKMAKQCRLSVSDFCDLIDCPLTKEMYYEKLKKSGAFNK